MRWSPCAALGAGLALALLASVATAQNASGHVLMDMTVRVAPGATEGHCLLLDAGTLEVSLRSVDDLPDGPTGPPVFALGPYRTRPAARRRSRASD